MLKIHSSNHTEALTGALLMQLANAPADDPFQTMEVIVPSVAMRRRLQHDVAGTFGICANVRFSFLAQWLWEQVAKVIPVAEQSPFAPERLLWRIDTLLNEPAFVDAHPRLRAYLGKADPVMAFDLAGRIAALFDRYTTYRADWMEAWLHGRFLPLPNAGAQQEEDQRWQMALWARIGADLRVAPTHPFTRFLSELNAASSQTLHARGLPQEAHLFALPGIPPLYLDMVCRLAQQIDVHLYLLNPCRDYWFEVADPRRIRYLAAAGKETYLESGNRLLASWGKQTQSGLGLIVDVAQAELETPDFRAPGEDTLLHRLQSAILDMRDLMPGSCADLAADHSIAVHVCHTLVRELEVLHDQLLDLFNGDDPPRASEVLVLVPRLDEAAPLIDAVFGSAEGARRIAYTVTGRPGSLDNPVARALMDLLALAGSRYRASEVFALLQNPLVAARFRLTPEDLDIVREWLAVSGMHWGLDDAHPERFGDASARGTLEAGLDRLHLAYAAPAGSEEPFLAMLPPCNAEGEESRILGRFTAFVARLKAFEETASTPALPMEWQQRLLRVLDEFLDGGPELVEAFAEVRAHLVALVSAMTDADVERHLPVAVIKAALQQRLDDPARGGSPSGAVTFSAISSLRNLPYRVICLVGMSDGTFPGQDAPAEFDLMTAFPRKGDRTRRDEERNFFLDALLCARERLLITYTGRSVRDNAPLPPAALVADLIDYLAEACTEDPDDRAQLARAREALLVEHPLQPFSERYFDGASDPRLISYHAEYCAALQARHAVLAAAGRTEHAEETAESNHHAASAQEADDTPGGESEDSNDSATPDPALRWFVQPLPPPEAEWRQVSLEQMLAFFKNPARYLIKQRMRLRLPDEAPDIADHEATYPSGLVKTAFAGRMLAHLLEGTAPDRLLTLALAGLDYPSGPIGSLQIDDALQALQDFADRLHPWLAPTPLPAVSHELVMHVLGETWTLQGAWTDLRDNGLTRYRFAKARAHDYLAAWLHHLFLNATGDPLPTRRILIDSTITLRAMAQPEAREALAALVALYRQGLMEPLPFYPETAWACVSTGRQSATSTWLGSADYPGESGDFSYSLALRGVADPLDQRFVDTAHAVFDLLCEYLITDAP